MYSGALFSHSATLLTLFTSKDDSSMNLGIIYIYTLLYTLRVQDHPEDVLGPKDHSVEV